MDPPDRLADRGAVGGERARPHDPHGAAARPLLMRPVGLEVLPRMPGFRAEELLELGQYRGPPVAPRQAPEMTGGLAADEAEDDPLRGASRRVVECRRDRPVQRQGLPREVVVAPEGLAVDAGDLDQGSLGEVPDQPDAI